MADGAGLGMRRIEGRTRIAWNGREGVVLSEEVETTCGLESLTRLVDAIRSGEESRGALVAMAMAVGLEHEALMRGMCGGGATVLVEAPGA